MKTSQVLQQAKKYLAKDYQDRVNLKLSAICFALREATLKKEIDYDSFYRVRNMIHERLGSCISLRQWLELHHRIGRNGFSDIVYEDKLQVTRHAWIDSMIAEFSAAGD